MSYKDVSLKLLLGCTTILILLILSKSVLYIDKTKIEIIYNVLTQYLQYLMCKYIDSQYTSFHINIKNFTTIKIHEKICIHFSFINPAHYLILNIKYLAQFLVLWPWSVINNSTFCSKPNSVQQYLMGFFLSVSFFCHVKG